MPGDGTRWLIDCGRQAPDQLHHVGLTWQRVDGQIITHVHGDHTFGLEDFAFSRYYDSRDGVAPIIAGGPRPKMIVHTGVEREVWESMVCSLGYLKTPDGNPRGGTLRHYFDVLEPAWSTAPRHNPWPHAEAFVAGGLSLVARETEHVPGKPSVALELAIGSGASDDRIAWWSGDSVVDARALVDLEPRCSIMFHDCTFRDYPGQVHGSFTLLEQLPERVRRKMVLMHHEDDIEENRARAERAGFRVGFPGQVYDLRAGERIV
jgi:ribonuclease BN (tRNA processing enzyme)